MTRSMKRLFRYLFSIIIVFLCSVNFGLSAYATDFLSTDDDNTDSVIKVGFFCQNGYHEIDEDGNLSGYGYELMERIRSYTGLNFSYVGYDKSWNDMLEMLENGEIDILSEVNRTEERDARFIFSDYTTGISSFGISCLKGNGKYRNIYSIDGARIGFLNGDCSFDKVSGYLGENNITFSPYFYENEEVLLEALKNNSIDLVGLTNFTKSDLLSSVAYVGEDYSYIAASKNNDEIMKKINQGLEILFSIEPAAVSNLAKKYGFETNNSESIFTRDELDYIEKRKGNPIKCLCTIGMNPIAYINDNKVAGIIPDYIRLISDKTGLSFNIYGISSDYDILNDTSGINAQLRLDSIYDYNKSRHNNSILSIPYITIGSAKVFRADSSGEGIEGIIHFADYDKSILADDSMSGAKQFGGLYEISAALSEGEIDFFYVPSYVAQFICSEYSEYGLEYVVQNNTDYQLCFENYDNDIVLSRILSKAIGSVSAGELQEVIAYNLSYNEKGFKTFADLFEMYTWLPFAIWLAGLSIIAVVIILLYKAYTSKREHALALENLSYFKSILGANLFAVKAEASSDTVTYTIYYFNEKDTFGTGITEHLLTHDDVNSYRNRIYPEDIAAFDDFISLGNLKKLTKENMPAYLEVRASDSTGRYIYVSLSAHSMPAFNENDNILIVVKNIDLTKKEEEEKRKTILLALETAKRYSDSKTRFLSQMSHDIRTPLNAIVGMGTIARMNLDNKAKVEECLDIIEDSSDHLLALVSDILDMTKIESGKLSFSNKRVNLAEILHKSANMFNSKVKSANIDFTVECSDINHVKVVTDPTRLEQVFTNILSNATKYTPPGGKVAVRLYEIEPVKENLYKYVFSVKDTGIGMDSKTIEIIFNPFERAEAVEYMEGVGLGMAITKNIIDALGGEISVSSHPGLGTEVMVTFTFPDEIKNSLFDFRELHGRGALIISNDKMLCDLLTAIFEEGKMIVDVFSDLTPMCESLMNNRDSDYAVVAVSLDQPVSDEALVIKQVREQLGEDPILFDITAEDISVFSDICEENVLDGILPIPCYKNNVIRLISDGLDKRRASKKTSMKMTCKGKHALIVEDVDINAIFAQAITEMKGFESDIAENGLKAVEFLERSEDGYYSIVLMDIQMPVMNGYEATKVIRSSTREYLKRIPIIAMSANTFDEDVLKCKQVGMNDHIAKPVDVNRFSELVDIYVKD